MSQIDTLPGLKVYVGVGRASWRDSTGQTLIDITDSVRGFSTNEGKQHELDRFECGTLTMFLENRLGNYTPFDTATRTYPTSTGGTTSSYAPQDLAQPMTYLQVTATWSGTMYNVFSGYVSSWQLQTPDEVNSDVTVQAEDATKILSTTRLQNGALYPSTVADQLASYAIRWELIRCGDAKLNAAGGLTATGSYLWTRGNPSVLGSANTGAVGPHTYDPSTGIDLSNGTNAPAGAIVWPDLNPSNTTPQDYYLEAWVKGAQTGDIILANYRPNQYEATGVGVDAEGHLRLQRRTLTSGAPTDATLNAPHTGPSVTDGGWHLIGLQNLSGAMQLFCDGQPVGDPYTDSGQRLRVPSVGSWIGGTTTLPVGGYGTTATVADVFIMRDYNGLGLFDQSGYAHDRYRVGALLGTNTYSALIHNIAAASGAVTFTASGFQAGQTVQVSGCTPTGYNGTYVVSSATASTFTVASSTTGAATAFGVATVPYKTTGYRALEALEVAGVVDAVPAPGLTTPATGYTGLPYMIRAGSAITGVEPGTAYNRSPAEICLVASDTELGAFLWNHRTARFEFQDRFWWAANLASGIVATMSDQPGTVSRYQPGPEIATDDLDVWTAAAVSDAQSVNYSYEGTTVEQYGRRLITRATDADGQNTADGVGQTLLYRHETPRIRTTKVELSSVTGSVNMTAQLTLKLGDAVKFERHDAGATIMSQPFVVESVKHTFEADPGRWLTSYVLSPYEIAGAPYFALDGPLMSGSVTLGGAMTGGTAYAYVPVVALATGVAAATMTAAHATGSVTSLEVDTVEGFPASGTVAVAGTTARLTYTYTGVTRAVAGVTGAKLTGCTLVSGSSAIAIGQAVQLCAVKSGTVLTGPGLTVTTTRPAFDGDTTVIINTVTPPTTVASGTILAVTAYPFGG